MRLRNVLVVVTVLLFGGMFRCAAQATNACSVSEIRIDDKVIPTELWSSIALRTQSSIQITYGINPQSNPNPFRYVVRLATRDQESVVTTDMQTTSKSFSSLSQGFYSFEVRAQGMDSAWISTSTTLRFVVDDQQATLFEKFLAQKGSAPVVIYEQSTTPVILLGTLLTVAVIVIIILLIRRKKVEPTAIEKLLAETAAQSQDRASEEERREQQLNEAKIMQMLKDEVVTLRKENDNLVRTVNDLSRKTLELNSQNSDLEVQVERVSKVKTELESLQRQKDDVFAVIVHDIKNPASLIKNLVDLLRSYDLNSNETHEVLQDIVDTTTRIVSMSQELSRMMALDQPDIHVTVDDVDVSSLVQAVSRRNNAAAQKKGIQIDCSVPGTPVHSFVDNEKIEEVVDNLVSNAIKFSLPGTTVKVRVVGGSDFFTIEVEDQGIGMSKEDIQNAFQRGVRLSARPTGDEPSSGLGLWIVKRLVEAHEGSVSIQSEVGVGTTFTIHLPYRTSGDQVTT